MVVAKAFNDTKGTTVASHVRVAKSIWSRFWGLMGRGSLPPEEGLWITPCSSIHTFFMRFPIDAVFLDRTGHVVKIVHAIKPWRAAVGGPGAYCVLELNPGQAASGSVEAGDLLVLAEP
jgi:uncharacterized membrane protein (UPF0127 family)